MSERAVVLELTRMEALHLSGLVGQFSELLAETDAHDDPAIARLVPDAYRDDPAAAREFREVTQRDLLERRSADAAVVLATVAPAAGVTAETGPDDPVLMEVVELRLDSDQLQAWLRCLAALRLVLAERLGIRTEADHDGDDPRFGVYEWLGYRLDGLVRAASER